jgi:hypothetical protein
MRLIGLSAVVLGLLLASAAPIRAATYRTHIARDPEDPYPFEGVTIWMNSDTVFGETAGVEYTIVGTGTYTRVLGIYDNTGWPGANWYAEIPAFPAGTQITYQLFTRNQFGSDYGFTGFNWSYTVRDLPRYVAQLPTVPVLTQSPRVWIASTLTPPGEAGVILDQPGGPIEYTGTYSPTGYPGANWYVDLPARPAGTLVTYHFYSDNQAGQFNENFNGRNYTVVGLPDTVYVDDSWAGAVSGSNLGQPGLNFGGNAFATIQDGVRGVAPGGNVNVYSGAYTENVVITQALTLAGIDPADTIILQPAVSNPNCGGAGGGSLCPGGSNLLLVQADNVTLHDLTLDGDNPALTSGVVRDGADLDARNGIIENHVLGIPFNNLTVYNTTIRNIYLRGLYASSGGDSFNLYDNTVQNVQGDPAGSVAIMNSGGSGNITHNTVAAAIAAIVTDESRSTYILDNSITASGSGVRTDRNGATGGAADVLERNTVGSCTAGGSGIEVVAPYLAVTVQYNTVTGCAVGLAVAGQSAPIAPVFFDNTVDGQSLPGSTGIYVTTDRPGSSSSDVAAEFNYNVIVNTATGIELDEEPGYQLTVMATNHSLLDNTMGLAMTGGDVTFAGNNVADGTTAVTQSGGTLLAYANNFTGYATPLSRTGGTTHAAHNWWGTYVYQPTGVSNADWQARLGAPLVVLGGRVVWATGSGSAELEGATLSGGTGTAVIVNHGHSYSDAPFGNVRFDNMCSSYYDFFTVNGSGTWTVSVPVDDTPECTAQTLEPGKLFWIPPDTDYAADCLVPNNENPACWDLITTNISTAERNITVTGLSASDLGGTQFVAGSDTGSDPTAVTLRGLTAATDRSTTPAALICGGTVIASAVIVLVTRRRR